MGRLEKLIDTTIVKVLFRRPWRRPAKPTSHVLIAPPGGGNIGDQALVESFVENSTGTVTVLVRAPGSIQMPASVRDRATVVPLPGLLEGRRHQQIPAAIRLRRMLRTAASLSVVGADVMDGAYNPRASRRRAQVLRWARAMGVPARVLGFSWNGNATAEARRELLAASEEGAVLLLRDPVSAARARRDGLANVVDAADMVFAATTVDRASAVEEVESLLAGGSRLAIVNVSALVSDEAVRSGYVSAVTYLRSEGLAVLLLPHVSREGGDDMAACAEVLDQFTGDSGVTMIDRLLAPAQVRAVCERATVVLTGRMHLGVMALSVNVPAVVVGTQGKVEGLMELFHSSELCLHPGPGFEAQALEALQRVLADHGGYVSRIATALPRVRELAAVNFDMRVASAGK